MNNLFLKGSIWQKWDLHVHTKNTAKNDQFISPTFQDFCITLFKKAVFEEIVAIGITDYFNIDNYKKVIEFVSIVDDICDINGQSIFTEQEKKEIKRILILPNVELRMMPSTNKGRLVNIHCLFNPAFISTIENDFFNSIIYIASSGKSFQMNKSGIIGLGKFLDKTLSDELAYKKGLDNFVVTHDQLQKLYDTNSTFRNNSIIVVSNSSTDGASAFQQHYDLFENDASSLDAVRKSIYCISHAIFSSNPEDRKYFLGEKNDNIDIVKDKCGSIKPCIHGCDAHTETKLFKPDNHLYCWIKAENTFNGLKQIICDPKERVKVQERNPSDSKSARITIDYISYKDADGNQKVVDFNKDLNSIIGTRGSGKSTLLKNIAYSIDPEQFCEKDRFTHLYKLNSFDVYWLDGKKNSGDEDSPKNVFYIPQNYLSSLAYDDGDKSKERDQFLTRLLKKHINFASAVQKFEEFISSNKIQMEGYIESLLKSHRLVNETQILLRKQGSKKEILKEIEDKNKEIQKYKNPNSQQLTELELYNYAIAKKELAESNNKVLILNQDKLILNRLIETGAAIYIVNQEFNNLSLTRQELIKQELSKKNTENLSILIKSELNTIDEQLKEILISINNKQRLVDEVDNKIKLNKALSSLTKEVSDLHQIIGRVDSLTEALAQAKSQKELAIDCLVKTYNDFDIQREVIFKEVKFSQPFSFLNIEIVTVYNIEDLKKFVELNINTRDTDPFIKQDPDIINLFSNNPNKLNSESLKKVLINLVEGKIKIKVDAGDISQAISQLLKNRYEIDYLNSVRTKDNRTHFKDMTGGQKAIAMLELIFKFDDEKYPILIDQPEDDLDVAGVANDLVNFIKSEKEERQIIIASHNASLVICADSEEIIVSRNTRNTNNSYNFSYSTGAIENSIIRDKLITILEGGKEALRQRARKLNLIDEI